jgi:nucleoside phosphorylase
VIAITFALPAESAAFIKALRDKQRERCGEFEIVRGKIDNRSMEIFHTGVGEKICRQRMATLLQYRRFELLISAGFAGALSDRLKPGDVFVAENFSTAKVPAANMPVQFGKLVTAGRVIDSPAERERIARSTGAAAVDMETEFIARACAEHAVPMISLRTISDTPAHPLPLQPPLLFDIDEQKTKVRRLAGHLIAHPTTAWKLMRFAKQIRKARNRLTRAIIDLLRASDW